MDLFSLLLVILLFAVTSGLYQAPRIARLRHLSEQQVGALVARFTQPRTLSVLGEPRINVLELNLALDNIKR